MTKFLTLFLLVMSFQSFAKTFKGTIIKIDEGHGSEPHLIMLDDGRVLKLSSEEKFLLPDLQNARDKNLLLKFHTNTDRMIHRTEPLRVAEGSETQGFESFSSYQPTVLNNIAEAQHIFRNLKRGARSSSQCYNRAHVWSYESKQKHNLDSMKVFVFYTRKYIREFNFDWWFHVAPFTYVNENGAVTERVLDFRFSKEPLLMKPWTDIFMRNKVECPVVEKYSQYENHQEAQYCYLIKESMYYLQPLDLDNLERTGKVKDQWIQYEVKRAYRNGFDGWW